MLDTPSLWHFEAYHFIFPNRKCPVIFASECIYNDSFNMNEF